MRKTITNSTVNESYKIIKHKSGLTIYMCHLDGFDGTHVQFAAPIGSVNTKFKTEYDDDFFVPPYGVAHFLEHKMFEDEDGDAFLRFAKTGASANAFTTFDKTSYLFGCTDKFYDSLEILLDFVMTPYFTEKGTEKEKGIIAEEINMYKDNAGWCVFFNLLNCLYHNHPVKIDIAGTVDSINEITKETLYKCYNTFYNLNNMVLSICGNFDEEKVLNICDKILKTSKSMNIKEVLVDEPNSIYKQHNTQVLPVSIPIFDIGFKELPLKKETLAKTLISMDIILEYIAGDTSELFKELYNDGLINQSFGYEIFYGKDYLSIIFGGESVNPQEVYKRLLEKIEKIKISKIPVEHFDICKKSIYGTKIKQFENPASICGNMVDCHFDDRNLFLFIDTLKTVTIDDCNTIINNILKKENSAISIVKGE